MELSNGSRGHHAAVHSQNATGRPARLIRGEVDRGLRDIFRLSKPTERVERCEPGLGLWISQDVGDAWSLDTGGTDAVAKNLVLCIMHCHCLGQHNHSGLLRLVGMTLKDGNRFEPA